MPITHTSLFISKHGRMKRQRILCICTILCSLAWVPGSAVAAATSTQGAGVGASVLGLDEAVAIAIADNPNLAQMQARYEARSAVPSQVGTLPVAKIAFGWQEEVAKLSERTTSNEAHGEGIEEG